MFIARKLNQRRLHKAYLRYHDPKNWDMIRESLQDMKRTDLIGDGPQHLVPSGTKPGRKNSKGKFQQARGGQWDNRSKNTNRKKK